MGRSEPFGWVEDEDDRDAHEPPGRARRASWRATMPASIAAASTGSTSAATCAVAAGSSVTRKGPMISGSSASTLRSTGWRRV